MTGICLSYARAQHMFIFISSKKVWWRLYESAMPDRAVCFPHMLTVLNCNTNKWVKISSDFTASASSFRLSASEMEKMNKHKFEFYETFPRYFDPWTDYEFLLPSLAVKKNTRYLGIRTDTSYHCYFSHFDCIWDDCVVAILIRDKTLSSSNWA